VVGNILISLSLSSNTLPVLRSLALGIGCKIPRDPFRHAILALFVVPRGFIHWSSMLYTAMSLSVSRALSGAVAQV
jgi:hypothetical protein